MLNKHPIPPLPFHGNIASRIVHPLLQHAPSHLTLSPRSGFYSFDPDTFKHLLREKRTQILLSLEILINGARETKDRGRRFPIHGRVPAPKPTLGSSQEPLEASHRHRPEPEAQLRPELRRSDRMEQPINCTNNNGLNRFFVVQRPRRLSRGLLTSAGPEVVPGRLSKVGGDGLRAVLGFDVGLKVALPVGAVRAQRAAERLQSCVNLHVSLEVGLAVTPTESLGADVADQLPAGMSGIPLVRTGLHHHRQVRGVWRGQAACRGGRGGGLPLKHKSKKP
ncbi:hypothetical protein E2C01_003173 [Portunus trituberculatus]|uniref:Uncharacterized protein n=1 Tax=Portunus trituberculatus TaxID=210409 RepID=A0A5B7CQB4_PORTR|nr:hypothetical protein [Portunus trituberculatus]